MVLLPGKWQTHQLQISNGPNTSSQPKSTLDASTVSAKTPRSSSAPCTSNDQPNTRLKVSTVSGKTSKPSPPPGPSNDHPKTRLKTSAVSAKTPSVLKASPSPCTVQTKKSSKTTKHTPLSAEDLKSKQSITFEDVASMIAGVDSYNELEHIVVETKGLLPPLPLPPKDLSLKGLNRRQHNASIDLIPSDVLLSGDDSLLPVNVYGDGNCLARCLSLLAYGHERCHTEMRMRVVYELVCNRDLYLLDRFLRPGNLNAKGDIALTFASYSEVNDFKGKLNHVKMCSILCREIMNIKTMNQWMGIWQLSSAANILGRPVVSVYPTYGGHTVRADLNRVFLPNRTYSCLQPQPVHIMWTSMRGKIGHTEKSWNPNHFVVLLPEALPAAPDKPVEEANIGASSKPVVEIDFDVFMATFKKVT